MGADLVTLSNVQTIWVTFKEFQFSQERKKSYNVPPNWLGAKVDPKFTMVKEVMKAESQKKPSFDLVFGSKDIKVFLLANMSRKSDIDRNCNVTQK